MSKPEDLMKELADVRAAHARYNDVEEWGGFVSLDHFTEFNVIFPVLLEGKDVLSAVKGARFNEPAVKDGSYFDELRVTVSDTQVVKTFENAVLTTYTGQTAKLLQDGTIRYQTTRSTQLAVRINGKLMLVHSHSSPPGDAAPPYHDKDQFG